MPLLCIVHLPLCPSKGFIISIVAVSAYDLLNGLLKNIGGNCRPQPLQCFDARFAGFQTRHHFRRFSMSDMSAFLMLNVTPKARPLGRRLQEFVLPWLVPRISIGYQTRRDPHGAI